MRIGIDMLGIQSPGGFGRDSSRLGRRLVSSLQAHRSGHQFVFYSRENVQADLANCSKGRSSIVDVIEHNPDNLDWLVLLDPFTSGERGIAPRARLDGVKVASVITDFTPARENDRRLAPLRTHDAILTFSDDVEVECLERLSTLANQIVNLGLGVDHSWSCGGSNELDAEYLQRLEITCPFLLANLAAGPETSNLAGILEAYSRVPRALRNSHQLVIVGAVTDPWAAVRFLQEHDCAEGLVLVGRVDDQTLRLLYGRCAAFITPSFANASALSIVEAMSRGAAVLAGRAGSQPSILSTAGLLAEPSNPSEISGKITLLLSDLDHTELLRRRALERSRDFAWEPVVDRFLAVLEGDGPGQVPFSAEKFELVHSGDWINEFISGGISSSGRLADEIGELESFEEPSFAALAWEDVTIHVLTDVFSVRSQRDELERQPGLVLLRDESSLDRIEVAGWKSGLTLSDVEAEVACSRLLEIFASSSRVAVRSPRNLSAIRSRFPEYADQVVLIPPRCGVLPRDRVWSVPRTGTADGREVDAIEIPEDCANLVDPRGNVHESPSFPRMPGLTPLPLDV